MICFTADTHFFDESFVKENSIKYKCPLIPWPDGWERESLVRNRNARVSEDDDVYILGDFAAADPALAEAVLERLFPTCSCGSRTVSSFAVRGSASSFATTRC